MQMRSALLVPEEMVVGKKIRLARMAAGLTIPQLAQATEMSRWTLERIESGVRQPTLGELLAIAHFTGQDPQFFGASLDRPAEAPTLPLLPADVNSQEER